MDDLVQESLVKDFEDPVKSEEMYEEYLDYIESDAGRKVYGLPLVCFLLIVLYANCLF